MSEVKKPLEITSLPETVRLIGYDEKRQWNRARLETRRRLTRQESSFYSCRVRVENGEPDEYSATIHSGNCLTHLVLETPEKHLSPLGGDFYGRKDIEEGASWSWGYPLRDDKRRLEVSRFARGITSSPEHVAYFTEAVKEITRGRVVVEPLQAR